MIGYLIKSTRLIPLGSVHPTSLPVGLILGFSSVLNGLAGALPLCFPIISFQLKHILKFFVFHYQLISVDFVTFCIYTKSVKYYQG